MCASELKLLPSGRLHGATEVVTLSLLLADIVEIKHIMLPPSPREFKDIYVVFELMETDLHQVRHWHTRSLCSSFVPCAQCIRISMCKLSRVLVHMVCVLSQVIKANDDLTPEHHQFFLYQMLRGLKYIHTGAETCPYTYEVPPLLVRLIGVAHL